MNGEEYTTAHLWIGTFDKEESFFDYVEGEAADIVDELDYVFFEKTYSALDILNLFGLESMDTFDKYMTMQANAAICLYGYDGQSDGQKECFEKILPSLRYLGEFYIAEPEDIVNEGRYDAEI